MEIHRPGDDATDLFGGLDEVDIRKVGIPRRGPVSPVPEQLAYQRQILARHDGLAGRRVPQVM